MSGQESSKKLRDLPPELEFITLDEIAGRLADIFEVQVKILKHLEETTPVGVDFPIPEKTVTEVSTVNLLREYPYRPLRKVNFFNKGPNTAYIRINEEAKEFPVENREDYSVERPRATIEYITLRVASGKSAIIKMIGSY